MREPWGWDKQKVQTPTSFCLSADARGATIGHTSSLWTTLTSPPSCYRGAASSTKPPTACYPCRVQSCWHNSLPWRNTATLFNHPQKLTAMINIGKLIHEQVKRQGKSVTWLAQQLNYSRTNLYKIFDKTSIDTDVLLRISQALNYDFFALYSQELSSRHWQLSTYSCTNAAGRAVISWRLGAI